MFLFKRFVSFERSGKKNVWGKYWIKNVTLEEFNPKIWNISVFTGLLLFQQLFLFLYISRSERKKNKRKCPGIPQTWTFNPKPTLSE